MPVCAHTGPYAEVHALISMLRDRFQATEGDYARGYLDALSDADELIPWESPEQENVTEEAERCP